MILYGLVISFKLGKFRSSKISYYFDIKIFKVKVPETNFNIFKSMLEKLAKLNITSEIFFKGWYAETFFVSL